jgi:exodeoxyribonuclease-3/AP endonuclease-1
LTPGAKSFKAVCWNLGGLRAFARNRPDALPELARREKPDVLGIIEHKLQDGAADTESTMKTLLESLPDYETAALHCSTAKKGYSGTLILLRKEGPKPLKVEACDLPSAKDEGRLIVVEFEALFVVLAYVPNSGDGLKRLDQRIGEWDVQLREKLVDLACKKATLLLGDLNVAHRDEDIWNVEAPHVAKSAGTTPEERASFSTLLSAGFVDGFANMHPEAIGAFTYWSVRAGNRPKNRGLRLDYAVASSSLLAAAGEPGAGAAALVDVFHLPDMSQGDHCPVGALLRI